MIRFCFKILKHESPTNRKPLPDQQNVLIDQHYYHIPIISGINARKIVLRSPKINNANKLSKSRAMHLLSDFQSLYPHL